MQVFNSTTERAGRGVLVLWALAAASFISALLLLTHAYSGIRHDSILYFGQALLQLDPSTFSKDLFFEFGSQAQFTVFPQLMAWAMQHATPSLPAKFAPAECR
jgi:hypothetical protein